jgi:hypothetical protein
LRRDKPFESCEKPLTLLFWIPKNFFSVLQIDKTTRRKHFTKIGNNFIEREKGAELARGKERPTLPAALTNKEGC